MSVGGARNSRSHTAMRRRFAKTRSMRGFQREPPSSCRPPIIRRRRHPEDAMEHSRAAMPFLWFSFRRPWRSHARGPSASRCETRTSAAGDVAAGAGSSFQGVVGWLAAAAALGSGG